MEGAWMKNRRLHAGTSLIEVLTVIVVFMVGILAVIQIFPNGLRIIRETKNNSTAIALAKSEAERVSSRAANLPELIVPVVFGGSSGFTGINIHVNPDDLTVPLDSGVGKVDSNGNVIVGGLPVGHWTRTSGPNVFSRVIGEGGPVPAPRMIGPDTCTTATCQYGGLIQLMFAPLVYDVDGTTFRGRAGQVLVYGNNLTPVAGDQSDLGNLVPVPDNPTADSSTVFLVPAAKAQNSPAFANEDQVWIPSPLVAGIRTAIRVRMRLIYSYVQGGNTRTSEGIFVADPANAAVFAQPVGSNYGIVSLKQLIGTSGMFGSAPGTPSDYRGVVPGSVSAQRLFDEVATTAAWDQGNPYQYKVLSMGLGAILVSQFASDVKVTDTAGDVSPLTARVDYTVYDWRIVRDEFRLPESVGGSVKLVLNSLKPKSGSGPDGQGARGLGGFATGDLANWTPAADGTNGSQDFVLMDLQTGGIILGNDRGNSSSCYYVDKTSGVITFRSVDESKPGLQAYVAYPTGIRTPGSGGFVVDPSVLWAAGATENIAGHSVRALYRGNGEFATQVMKAASSYQVSYPATASALGAGECFVGGSNDGTPWGDNHRLYFPLADLGQKVVAAEVYTNLGVLRDQDLQVDKVDPVLGVAYATLPNGATFDYTTGYAVRFVRGVSLRVRSLWNPDSFTLGPDQDKNFESFQNWARSWRKVNTETIEIGGQSK